MSVAIPSGVFDIIPNPSQDTIWRSTHLWHYVENVIRNITQDYGYSEIRTPIFERAELFLRSVGEATDIVSKEMYLFQDRGARQMALRPEGTASVIRAIIEHGVFSPVHALRYFYIGPMFRYERPQAGRFRQHHQFGVEVFGVPSPEQDSELISLMINFYKRLGLPALKVYINSLGDDECRMKFRKALVAYLTDHKQNLSEESKDRLERNPLRILDSKDPGDQNIVAKAPVILDFLSPEDTAHFQRVQEMLAVLQIPFEVNHLLVRGLDYYQKTVFEVTSGKLGAQNSIGGGGRYDGLVRQLGGPDLSSIGFGIGIERVIQLMVQEGIANNIPPHPLSLVIIPMMEQAKTRALLLAEALRALSVRTIVDFQCKKVSSAIGLASDAHAQWILVLGEQELNSGRAVLKRLRDGVQIEIALDNVDEIVHLVHAQ